MLAMPESLYLISQNFY